MHACASLISIKDFIKGLGLCDLLEQRLQQREHQQREAEKVAEEHQGAMLEALAATDLDAFQQPVSGQIEHDPGEREVDCRHRKQPVFDPRSASATSRACAGIATDNPAVHHRHDTAQRPHRAGRRRVASSFEDDDAPSSSVRSRDCSTGRVMIDAV